MSKTETIARFEQLFHRAPGMFLILDVDFTIAGANEAFTRERMVTREAILGKSIFDAFPEHPDDPTAAGTAQLRASLERVLETGAADEMATVRHEFRRPAGEGGRVEDRYREPLNYPILDDEGRVILIVHQSQDVSDRVRSQRRETTDRQEADRAIREQAEQLRQNDRRKEEFLAMLAHELRNPLSAVGNAVTVMKLSDDPENLGFARDVIERQVGQLSRLIDDLLDVSRISSGKIRLRRDFVDAGSILNQAVESVRPLLRERKHELICNFQEGALPLRADATRVEQIVVNLLTNAAKYTANGGRIRLSGDLEGDRVVIRVQDNGMGIPPEKLPEMFQLFAQGERSIARSEGGLGIGLTIVQKLAEMHGGGVSATSQGLGHGSTFTVHLPAAAPVANVDARAGSGPARSGKGSRILVVDDNEDTAKGMARLLKLLGNEVEVVGDGPSAIEAARSMKPEFVLLDIGLPGMDGYQVATILREDDWCRQSLIIAVSGYGQDEDRRRSAAAGFDHHLVKPVDFDSLLLLIGKGG